MTINNYCSKYIVTFYLGCIVSKITRFYGKLVYVIVISPPGGAARNFLIADSERVTPFYRVALYTRLSYVHFVDLMNFSYLPEMTS